MEHDSVYYLLQTRGWGKLDVSLLAHTRAGGRDVIAFRSGNIFRVYVFWMGALEDTRIGKDVDDTLAAHMRLVACYGEARSWTE